MDSILFDLDGTLWDSRDTVVAAWNKVIQAHGGIQRKISKQDLKQVMGLQMKEIGEKLLPEINKEDRDKLFLEFGHAENELLEKQGGILYPRLEEVLHMLAQKYHLFIVSNCQAGYIESFYAYHQLGGFFIDEENPGRTGLSKGENIKLVMERNHLEHPIYVGDTNGDMEAAKYAQIPFVYAKYGFGEVENYDYKIETFGELADLF